MATVIKSNGSLRIDQFRVLASVGRDLPEFCESVGVDIETIATSLKIDTADFADFEKRISLDRFCRLMETLATILSDDSFGLKYGQFFKSGGTGAFGIGLMAAPTFKDMLRFYGKYESTVADVDIFNTIIENDRFTIDWNYSPLITHQEQFADFAAVAGLRLFQYFLQEPVPPVQVRLKRRPPSDISLHNKVFSRDLTFGATSNRLVFSGDILTRENPKSDPVVFEFTRQKCEMMSNQLRRKKDIVTIVKEDFIQNMKHGECSIDKVAHRTGMSDRTLQRRLSAQGCVFSDLFDETRDELSLRMLRESDLPLSEISYALGYSSQSAYTRAVKRLHGMTPGQLRSTTQD